MNNIISASLYEEKAIKMMNSKDLIELADHFHNFLCFVRSLEVKEEAFIKIIEIIKPYQDRLITHTEKKNKKPYVILKGKKAITGFLWLIWPHTGNGDERMKELEAQWKIMNLTMRRTNSGDRLTPEKIDWLMQHIENKFSYCSKILENRYLKILLINNSTIDFNSFVLTRRLSTGELDDAVILTYPRPMFPYHQEMTLYHELGHILHIRLTDSSDKIPKCFQDGIHCPDKDPKEIFAEYFSASALFGTGLEAENQLSDMHKNNRSSSEYFFNLLINRSHFLEI